MKKIIITLVLLAAILVSGAFFFKSQIIKGLVETSVSLVLGAPCKIDKISFEWGKPKVYIGGMKIYNPKGFPDDVLMGIKDMNLLVDGTSLKKGFLKITYLDAEIDQIIVIKRADGRMNIDGLNLDSNDNSRFRIDVFELSIREVVYKDNTAKDGPRIEVYDVNIKDHPYKDIPSVRYFFNIIFQEALAKTAIEGAAVYGVAVAAGVTFWPVGVAVVLAGNDSASAVFNETSETLYAASMKKLQEVGKVGHHDEAKGLVKARIGSDDITVRIEKESRKKTKLTVSARKVLIPMPDYAKSVLYRISTELPGEGK